MITAAQARHNVAEYNQTMAAQAQSEAVAICEEKISPMIQDKSVVGGHDIQFKLDGIASTVSSRIAKILEESNFNLRFGADGNILYISW